MALLYPWATKEYILREMSLGQVILYLNVGLDIKYPKTTPDGKRELTDEDREQARKEMIEMGLIDKEELKKKYGDIEDLKEGG
jgi:hypothetical protein